MHEYPTFAKTICISHMIQKSSIFGILLIIGLYTVLTGCETEVDLTAPYKSTPVITAVLEYTTDTQFVRINRTYLADNNVVLYASNRDSVEYHPEEVEAWLFKKFNDDKRDSIQLEHIVKPSRDPGVFYNEDISFWYTTDELFTQSEIDAITGSNPANYTYELDVTARGQEYKGETDFPRVKNAFIGYPPANQPEFKVAFYSEQPNGTGVYRTQNFRYQQALPTARYQNILRLYFDYETENGTVVENQFIDYNLGIQEVNVSNPPSSGDPTFVTFNSENWYAFIGNILKDIPGIQTVKIEELEYRVIGANSILNSYINVTNPISDFTPVLSTFTNFDNGAIGILGSRTLAYSKFRLYDASIIIMNEGDYAYGLTYCVKGWAGSTELCL